MCPLQQGGSNSYTEAAIFVATRGRFAGEYVAACAKDECAYMSE
jgi:hypothetical protein